MIYFESLSRKCRIAPADVRRTLRQEANFGCAICGCPILENAHIIPYSVSHAFPTKDMVALCPNCHTRADIGGFSEHYLRHIKANPYNKALVKDRFWTEGQQLAINLGSNKFINTDRILVINDFEIITLGRNENNVITLNANFFDSMNRFVGAVIDNFWYIESSSFWDIEYRPQHLVIRNGRRNILLNLEIKENEVYLTGKLFYVGHPVIIEKESLWLDEKEVDIQLSNMTVRNFHTAIILQVDPLFVTSNVQLRPTR